MLNIIRISNAYLNSITALNINQHINIPNKQKTIYWIFMSQIKLPTGVILHLWTWHFAFCPRFNKLTIQFYIIILNTSLSIGKLIFCCPACPSCQLLSLKFPTPQKNNSRYLYITKQLFSINIVWVTYNNVMVNRSYWYAASLGVVIALGR